MIPLPLSDENTTSSLLLVRDNFAVFIEETETNSNGMFMNLLIQAIIESDDSFSITSDDEASEEDNAASVFLTAGFFEFLNDTGLTNDLPRIETIVYEQNSPLFQDQSPVFPIVGGVILSVSRSLSQGPPPDNLSDPILFNFETNQVYAEGASLNYILVSIVSSLKLVGWLAVYLD